jgi:branched-chain amino acid transport system substrate-binding protein
VELARLVEEFPASPLSGELSVDMAKSEFARGNYDRAYELLTELLYEFPDHKNAPEVRQLLKLAASRRDAPEAERVDYLEPNRLGVILPHTGNASRFGRYFEQGVGIAVDEYNASGVTQVSVVLADSKGTPVDAVKAVRKLVIEEGVIAVLGSVFTVPSIASAIECNAWKVPMLSPIVSDRRIEEIGPWIFQTKVSEEVEVSAMASVATEDLLLERFAVLAPTSSEKRKIAELFMNEIRSRGGAVVAEEYYRPGDTDFRIQLEAIRDAAPEALFIPGEPEELMNVLPQVSFYDMQLQLLGLSNWNSEKLLRISQRELEGAIFPREAYHGKDRQAYEQFVESYHQRHGEDIHSIAVSGYFGMRLLLQAIGGGALDREQVRTFLIGELNADAARRMQEANALSILRVRAGEVAEFAGNRRR